MVKTKGQALFCELSKTVIMSLEAVVTVGMAAQLRIHYDDLHPADEKSL